MGLGMCGISWLAMLVDQCFSQLMDTAIIGYDDAHNLLFEDLLYVSDTVYNLDIIKS